VEGKGYFEDRRPASNADPYQVTGIIVETLCGSVKGADMTRKATVIPMGEAHETVVVPATKS
jgi:glutamine synthetase